jgi:hypothetical protein
MKKLTFLVLIGLFLLGCKKYENDPFFSTYSPEARLTKGDNCVWTCVKYSPINGTAKDIPAFHYSLSLNDDKTGIAGFSDLGDLFEISNSQEWSLGNSKETLDFFGNYQINRLTMNQLELKDSYGNIYSFEKRKKQAITALDQEIINFPMFGIFPEVASIVEFESGEYGSISGYVGTTPMSSISGIMGKGEGCSGFEVNATFTFGRYFSKPGYITFWMRSYNGAPKIKLNGQQITDYAIVSAARQEVGGAYYDWYNVAIKVSTGNQTINITNYIGSGGPWDKNGISGIDEIRYWEIAP